LGTGCCNEERSECEIVSEQIAGERREQILTEFGRICCREKMSECDGVWEQVAVRGKVFWNRLLERGDGRL